MEIFKKIGYHILICILLIPMGFLITFSLITFQRKLGEDLTKVEQKLFDVIFKITEKTED